MNEIKCRQQPCETCPYRKDVPSGVWAAEEYAKLPDYDKPTGDQPIGIFFCHTTLDYVCNGWAITHAKNPKRGFEPLALRLAASLGRVLGDIPDAVVPLFASGAAAAKHGMKKIEKPTRKAAQAIVKLQAARAKKAKP